MVLFYDDDQHIKKTPPAGWRKYLRRLIKVIVIFALLLTITMWVLSTAGGNSKALRLGIQDYLTDATGYLAQLNRLESMEFFPVTHIQFADLTLHRPVKKEQTPAQIADEEERRKQSGEIPQLKGVSDYYDAGETVASIASADIRMNFWDMFFSRRRFYVLDVRNFAVEEGVWLPRRVHLETLRVDQDADFPAIIAQGAYGTHKLDMRVRTRKSARGAYEIPDVTQFQLQLGTLQAEGTVDSGGRTSRVEFTSLRVGEQAFTGALTIKARRHGYDVALTLNTGNSALRADLEVGGDGVQGTITAAALDIADLENMRAAFEELQALWGGVHNDRIAFGAHKMQVRLIVDKLIRGDAQAEWGSAKADMVVQPYLWQLNNIAGFIAGGALKGGVSIDATGTGAARLTADISLRGWDYARRGAGKDTEVTGQADAYLRLNGEGKTFDALKESITGELVVIGGDGALTRNTALYETGDVLTAMLPGLASDTALKTGCLLADFEMKGLQATAQTVFIDLSGLVITGAGSFDIGQGTLDMKLTPKLKADGDLSRAVSVRLKGPSAAPEITTSASVPGRINGATLPGSVDIAFSALSLNDLGLAATHPCHAYLKKP